jgi:hypothetical protein
MKSVAILISLKTLRNILIVATVGIFLFYSARANADIRWLVPENLCYDWGLDSQFPGSICAQLGYCSPEDSLPATVAFS